LKFSEKIGYNDIENCTDFQGIQKTNRDIFGGLKIKKKVYLKMKSHINLRFSTKISFYKSFSENSKNRETFLGLKI